MTRRLFAGISLVALVAVLCPGSSGQAWAQDAAPQATSDPIDLGELIRASQWIGGVILIMSLAMMALVIEHCLSIRRGVLVPEQTAAQVHEFIAERQFAAAERFCREEPSFLAHVLAAGLREAGAGYGSIEKAMEDASAAQAARLFRKIEYLSVIGTLAPMLGLLGTVWGMIVAFHEFKAMANPQVTDLATGIYGALVTTLLGLGVAVPALAAFAFFRNRIDELVADGTAVAEHVFFDYKCALVAARRKSRRGGEPARPADSVARGMSQEKT